MIENLNCEISVEVVFAEGMLCSTQPRKIYQNGLFLPFIWNMREEASWLYVQKVEKQKCANEKEKQKKTHKWLRTKP